MQERARPICRETLPKGPKGGQILPNWTGVSVTLAQRRNKRLASNTGPTIRDFAAMRAVYTDYFDAAKLARMNVQPWCLRMG